MTKFFSDLLLEERGVFTLFGDKPMIMSLLYYYTEEEFQAAYKNLPETIKKKTQRVEYDYAENWDKWALVKEKYSIERFLFAKRCISSDQKVFLGLFVNIAETALVLQENYEDFCKAVGFDFHPFKEVFHIGDETSLFWDIVFKNHALQGILLGFGKKNSYLFQWMTEEDNPEQCIEQSILQKTGSNHPPYGMTTLENLTIPVFRHYFSEENDRLLKKYDQQRSKIQEIYKKGDFLEITLKNLCYDPSR